MTDDEQRALDALLADQWSDAADVLEAAALEGDDDVRAVCARLVAVGLVEQGEFRGEPIWRLRPAWTPERREKAGRAVHAKHRAGAQAKVARGLTGVYVPPDWDDLSPDERACYCDQGEAAVRADEEGR